MRLDVDGEHLIEALVETRYRCVDDPRAEIEDTGVRDENVEPAKPLNAGSHGTFVVFGERYVGDNPRNGLPMGFLHLCHPVRSPVDCDHSGSLIDEAVDECSA